MGSPQLVSALLFTWAKFFDEIKMSPRNNGSKFVGHDLKGSNKLAGRGSNKLAGVGGWMGRGQTATFCCHPFVSDKRSLQPRDRGCPGSVWLMNYSLTFSATHEPAGFRRALQSTIITFLRADVTGALAQGSGFAQSQKDLP